MDLAFRTNWTPLFFEFIDSIGMIPAPSCLLARLHNVRRYNLNESPPVELLFRKKASSDWIGSNRSRIAYYECISCVRIIFTLFFDDNEE